MVIKKMLKLFLKSILIYLIISAKSFADDNFNKWLKNFQMQAIKSGISEKVVRDIMSGAKYLPKVIEYDRYQPEFYEDTFTYIKKRSSNRKINEGKKLYKKEKKVIETIEQDFQVEKELLLALMGIETNFGKYLGKMDIVSSLATLSFDKRRSEFFTKELIIVLTLIDKGIIDSDILFGSWAGAFGNFQFMPSTIDNYAIDFNGDKLIDLKSLDDSFASAANYLNKMGWKKNAPCFYPVELRVNTPKKLLNTSAKKIKNKRKFKYIKKYIANDVEVDENLLVGIITPDSDIVEGSNIIKPAFIVFDNYELILKWNRSLRFALAVCTLKDKFKNEL